MLLLKEKVESEKVLMLKELKKLAKDREEASQQLEQLEKAIAETCSTFMDV